MSVDDFRYVNISSKLLKAINMAGFGNAQMVEINVCTDTYCPQVRFCLCFEIPVVYMEHSKLFCQKTFHFTWV